MGDNNTKIILEAMKDCELNAIDHRSETATELHRCFRNMFIITLVVMFGFYLLINAKINKVQQQLGRIEAAIDKEGE